MIQRLPASKLFDSFNLIQIDFFKVTIPTLHSSTIDKNIIFYDICVEKRG